MNQCFGIRFARMFVIRVLQYGVNVLGPMVGELSYGILVWRNDSVQDVTFIAGTPSEWPTVYA